MWIKNASIWLLFATQNVLFKIANWYFLGKHGSGISKVDRYLLEPHEEEHIREKLQEFDDEAPGAKELWVFKGSIKRDR